jgi:hypothetical protein
MKGNKKAVTSKANADQKPKPSKKVEPSKPVLKRRTGLQVSSSDRNDEKSFQDVFNLKEEEIEAQMRQEHSAKLAETLNGLTLPAGLRQRPLTSVDINGENVDLTFTESLIYEGSAGLPG